jgi:hypothetical protein
MTPTGLGLYDPTAPDDVVLDIDGHDYMADGWAARYDTTTPPPRHKAGCTFATYGVPAVVCACQPPL